VLYGNFPPNNIVKFFRTGPMNVMNWREKDLLDLSLIELAYAHLSRTGSFELKHSRLESILPLTLNEIKHVRSNLYSRNFVPIVGSFGVIEQIGFSYSRNDMPAYSNAKASPINKALYYFAGFSEGSDDMKALYALRNSFLHSGSLLSKATHANKPSYYFQFNREMPELIKYPDNPWDGNIETFSVNQKTEINPEKVIDLAFSIRDTALECISSGTLQVELEQGEKELYYRFLKNFPR